MTRERSVSKNNPITDYDGHRHVLLFWWFSSQRPTWDLVEPSWQEKKTPPRRSHRLDLIVMEGETESEPGSSDAGQRSQPSLLRDRIMKARMIE